MVGSCASVCCAFCASCVHQLSWVEEEENIAHVVVVSSTCQWLKAQSPMDGWIIKQEFLSSARMRMDSIPISALAERFPRWWWEIWKKKKGRRCGRRREHCLLLPKEKKRIAQWPFLLRGKSRKIEYRKSTRLERCEAERMAVTWLGALYSDSSTLPRGNHNMLL